jgi:FtsH-binding integral membrane protein
MASQASAANRTLPPQANSDVVNWTPMIAVLGAFYAVGIGAAILSFFLCKRKRPGSVPLNDGAPTIVVQGVATTAGNSDIPVVQAEKPMVRSVTRPKSALFAGSTSPGIDLNSIEREIKMGFVRKVYCILATQLLTTTLFIVGAIHLSFDSWDPNRLTSFGFTLYTTRWLLWVSFIPLIAILCMLQNVKNKYPCNYIMLAVFTLIESVVLGIICVMYYGAGYGDQVLIAAAITAGIFIALTLFTMQSKIDWGFLGPGLFAGIFILIFWSWFTFWLLPPAATFRFQRVFSLLGAFLFCGFIIYDTNNIMKHFGVDDYIIAAIELYLDVINLFLYLLSFLSASKN